MAPVAIDDPVYHTDKYFYGNLIRVSEQVGPTGIGAFKASVELCGAGGWSKERQRETLRAGREA